MATRDLWIRIIDSSLSLCSLSIFWYKWTTKLVVTIWQNRKRGLCYRDYIIHVLLAWRRVRKNDVSEAGVMDSWDSGNLNWLTDNWRRGQDKILPNVVGESRILWLPGITQWRRIEGKFHCIIPVISITLSPPTNHPPPKKIIYKKIVYDDDGGGGGGSAQQPGGRRGQKADDTVF